MALLKMTVLVCSLQIWYFCNIIPPDFRMTHSSVSTIELIVWAIAAQCEEVKIKYTRQKHFWLRLGAKGVTMSVCPCGTNLSRAVNLHLLRSESNQKALREQSSTQRALKEHSESTQRAIRKHSESTQREIREHSERDPRALRASK